MSKNKAVLILGILIAIMPWLGLPSSWKNVFYFLAGAVLVIIAVVVHVKRRGALDVEQKEIVTEVFVENNGKNSTP